MPRIFVTPEMITGETVTLPETEARRITKVLRMRAGDKVTLFDGRKEYISVVTSLSPKSVTLKLTGFSERSSEPPISVVLGQGVPKGEKLEWTLQKAVELGVSAVVPVLMERSIKRPEMKDMEHRLARLRRIAVEAAQQSGRVCVPEVPAYMDLPMFIEYTGAVGLKVVLYEGERTMGLRDVLHGRSEVKSVALLVGPEGGLTTDEVEEAEAGGFIVAGLGPRILRTETAGIAALSIIQYELGDVG
jgi:16S rRNA (uracil1498-N3)-methyltransferase